ncbi:MAG: RNA polymerase sigma factor, partial [Gemmataceae bacterium]
MSSDASLLQRIAAGDADAVPACLGRYGGLVWTLALRALRNPADAEDAVQEVFIDLWRSAGRF